jgi:hypothetical protein
MAHLRIASANGESVVNGDLLDLLTELRAKVESGEVVGIFAILESDGYRTPALAGELDVDGIAGFTARVCASLANGEA